MDGETRVALLKDLQLVKEERMCRRDVGQDSHGIIHNEFILILIGSHILIMLPNRLSPEPSKLVGISKARTPDAMQTLPRNRALRKIISFFTGSTSVGSSEMVSDSSET